MKIYLKSTAIIFLNIVLLMVIGSAYAGSKATAALQQVLGHYRTYQARFVQRTYDGKGRLVQTSQGRVYLARPGRFRWEVTKPNQQLIIANGKFLWIYNATLQQATKRRVKRHEDSSPVALLTGNVSRLAKRFNIQAKLVKGFQLFTLLPRSQSGSFSKVLMWFHGQSLVQMRVINRLGQTNVFSFRKIKINAKINRRLFNFKPPAGVDVLQA